MVVYDSQRFGSGNARTETFGYDFFEMFPLFDFKSGKALIRIDQVLFQQ